MKTLTALAGVVPILATPFRRDESIDLPSLDRLVRFMAALGVDGVTVLGVLGEANRLTDRERDVLTQRRLTDDVVTLEELSERYGVSRERIRQIEVRAFEKLQKRMTELARERGMLEQA